MAWPKGKPRPPGAGRHKGSQNKKNRAIESITGQIIYDPCYQANLRQRAIDGTLAPGMEAMLWYYQFGKPKEQQVDEQLFMQELLGVVLKHVGSPEARQEIKAVIEAHAGATPLRVVA